MHKFESDQWIEKTKSQREMTGKDMFRDEKTGFLEKKDKSGFNVAKKVRFLELKKADMPDYEALKVVEVSRPGLYGQIAVDPEFRKAYVDIDETFTDRVEDMLKQNALTNKMATAERIFYLKKKRPQIYADKIEVNHKGSTDETVKELFTKMSQYQLIPKQTIIDVKGETDEGKEG